MKEQSNRAGGFSDLVERILEVRRSRAGVPSALASAVRELHVTQAPAATASVSMRLSPAARARIRRVLAERWREMCAAG